MGQPTNLEANAEGENRRLDRREMLEGVNGADRRPLVVCQARHLDSHAGRPRLTLERRRAG